MLTGEEEWEEAYLASVTESGRKDLNNPILYISKWWARRLMTPFSYAIDRIKDTVGCPKISVILKVGMELVAVQFHLLWLERG